MRAPARSEEGERRRRIKRVLLGAETAALLQRGLARAGSQAELARRVNLKPSHISRALDGLTSLGPEPCVLLADLIDELPSVVLRAFGHVRLSECLASLQLCTPRRGEIYDALDQLHPDDRELVGRFMNRLLSAQFPRRSEPVPVTVSGVRVPFRTLTSLVVSVEGDESCADVDTLMTIERSVRGLVGIGLLFSRDASESESPMLCAIEQLADSLYSDRASILRGIEESVRGRELNATLRKLLRMQSVTAYYVGLTLGWRTAQRFGGAR